MYLNRAPQSQYNDTIDFVSPTRFERVTPNLEGLCSIQLSYGDKYYEVSGAGLEPAQPKPQDFLTTIVFTTLTVCGLDYTFTISFDLGVPRLVSTRSFFSKASLGITISGFTEFEEFYSKGFPMGTQICKL